MTLADPQTKPPKTLETLVREAVNALAATLTKDRLGTGPMAQLRRMDPLGVPSPVFWTLLADRFGTDPLPEHQERAWAIIIQAMAVMAPDAHRIGRPPGRVLAEQGYPEGRFLRLLRAEGEGLAVEVRTLARWSAAKALAFDWADLALFVLARSGRDPDWAERQAIQLARPYFLNAGKKADTPDSGGDEA
ncbi:type I-E CRISPR-associated protein Cse2/CasB [Azospirillum griseum]|uniref:Type I-E CRISPR-associated protein Cse2/CasB n=1 Tax=Azospirillum griseum TaxID=2496639 RepID=A0A431VD98_9PROT|nr:type I-E CRISPR-associated protein Cse2/CasB [Azospirillum griseum]RTR17055.1 type I-E CRISPR-associated protein Cse2/CasB [Azospirillum griseum]